MIRNNFDIITNGSAVVLTAVQTEHTFQIICLVLTIISIIVSLAFNIWKWYVNATHDNKITQQEVSELHEHVNNAIDEVKETIEKEDKKHD